MQRSALRAWHLMRRIVVPRYGGPEVLECQDFSLPEMTATMGPTDVLVRNSFAGVNFIDVYFRSGLYKKAALPFVLGEEGSGGVVRCGSSVNNMWLGKRVAFFNSQSGSYCSFSIVNEKNIVEIPDGVTDEVAAAVLLQGCTAHYLARDCFKVGEGHTVLIHAAAGGTGLLLGQICKKFGATTIGTCGGAEKAEVAHRVGQFTHVIDYNANPKWDEVVKELVPSGVNAVFDGVGKSTFLQSLGCLRKRGHMITFGNASGAVDPIAPLTLAQFGSITLQRPKLADFVDTENGEFQGRVKDVFDLTADGSLQVTVGQKFPLHRAQEAHVALQARGTVGKLLLDCQE